MLTSPGVYMLLSPERINQSRNDALAGLGELETRAARLKQTRQRFIHAFRDQDDPMLVEEIRRLGTELNETERELVQARKLAKLAEYDDRRDFIERFLDAGRQLASDDSEERALARARLAQLFHRKIRRLVLHNSEQRISVEMQSPDDCFTEHQVTPAGLESARVVDPEGWSIRLDRSVWDAVAGPVMAGVNERVDALFLDRGSRAALNEADFMKRAILPDQIITRMKLREIARGEYEVIPADDLSTVARTR